MIIEVALMLGISVSNMLYLLVRSFRRGTIQVSISSFYESSSKFREHLEGFNDQLLSADFISDHLVILGTTQIYFAPVVIGAICLRFLPMKDQSESYLRVQVIFSALQSLGMLLVMFSTGRKRGDMARWQRADLINWTLQPICVIGGFIVSLIILLVSDRTDDNAIYVWLAAWCFIMVLSFVLWAVFAIKIALCSKKDKVSQSKVIA